MLKALSFRTLLHFVIAGVILACAVDGAPVDGKRQASSPLAPPPKNGGSVQHRFLDQVLTRVISHWTAGD